jgi:hypothetical protein
MGYILDSAKVPATLAQQLQMLKASARRIQKLRSFFAIVGASPMPKEISGLRPALSLLLGVLLSWVGSVTVFSEVACENVSKAGYFTEHQDLKRLWREDVPC